jgi:hypothetical protein
LAHPQNTERQAGRLSLKQNSAMRLPDTVPFKRSAARADKGRGAAVDLRPIN